MDKVDVADNNTTDGSIADDAVTDNVQAENLYEGEQTEENKENEENRVNKTSVGTVWMVLDKRSFVAEALAGQLEQKNIHVEKLNASGAASELEKLAAAKMILIYAEECIPDAARLLELKNKAIEADSPIFVCGTQQHIRDVEEIIEKEFLKHRFVRPFIVKEVVWEIENTLLKNKNREKKKILVVDDSGAVLRNVKGLLEDKYQVNVADSSFIAMKYLEACKPDLVLLDYQMPVCDGKELLEAMRANEEYADIPVIFLTSINDRESVLSVTALKPDGYMLKSTEPPILKRKIDEFFAKS